ncbi:glycosyltransferase family 4 protein [uncultured Maribacter sp.]|uniref:glycosyltransferase family 4 protein n=1 Tax=uncultured Maribacter sp. TaxID=431308 RepID=UPI002622FCF4|nr:glycosyltransferase family 4 protein [uncultured Maribacter sp.]
MRPNVIINAYACSPNKGSEPGMGWNWIISISKFCNIHIITEGEWKTEIEESITDLPQGINLTFYYLPVSDKIRNMCWNQGDWRFYYYYHKWQKRALKQAEVICETVSIDIIHQLNMVGYREPGMLWKIKDIPVVWGPIGGFGGIPTPFLKSFSNKEAIKQKIKQAINNIQVYTPYIQKAIKKSDVLIACNSVAKNKLQHFRKDKVLVISEAGSLISSNKNTRNYNFETLKILWIGRNIKSKALSIALETMTELNDLNIELNVLGVDKSEAHLPNEETQNVNFHSWIPHEEVQNFFNSSHLLLFTSLYEATGTVVLESLAKGVPVICHDTCGQGDIIDSMCGVKVPMKSVDYSIQTFSKEIRNLYFNKNLIKSLSDGAYAKAKEFQWENKGKLMNDIYFNLLNKK